MEIHEENVLYQVGLGTIGTVLFIVATFIAIVLGILNIQNNKVQVAKKIIFIAVLVWAIFTFISALFMYQFTENMWNIMKRFILLISLLIMVITKKDNGSTNTNDDNQSEELSSLKQVVSKVKMMIGVVIYIAAAINAVLLAWAIISSKSKIPFTNIEIGKATDLVNDIWSIIATLTLAVTTVVLSNKKVK